MSQSKQQQNLRKYWDRWFSVVQSVEAHRQGRISGTRYSVLYQNLLKACRAEESDGTAHAAVSAKLQNKIRKLVEPWVSLETLLHSDRRILQDLLSQCQEINDFMHPHLMRFPRKLAYLLGSLCLGLSLVGLHWMFGGETAVEDSVVESLGRLQRRVKYAIAQATLTQWLGVVAVVVVIMGASLTFGTRKS